ncbi:MAG TPA: hypothetical protein PLL30_16210 [Candidatus Krumholzibacteria bacterium]|nr:hypothetical protein [Candidatus Krumholzibacteria bacterium]HPD73315.1 hypothetical protein [Candidatus Krumholzibacteria bacterium]HRY42031.1 hypothetical protein [Candidatus Krumholzibacteria bacterium]
MSCEFYSYTFPLETDMAEVEEALLLATMAAEGLHGRARIQLDADFTCDLDSRRAVIAGGNEVGETIARIFTALLASTIGERAFTVERSMKAECV